LLIGIDFDNTLADYDGVFPAVAVAEGLLAAGQAASKSEVKMALRSLPAGEEKWMRLQGRVYGAHMAEAAMFAGAADFIRECRGRDIQVCVVSHKTEFGHFDPDRVNLRDAAQAWMTAQGFFTADGLGVDPDLVFFEPTRAEKIARIVELGCDHFIDDLIEVLTDPEFPARTQAHLFAPRGNAEPASGCQVHGSWASLRQSVLADA
jgi:hypothetical protein